MTASLCPEPHVRHFMTAAMPSVLRRMRCWRGLDSRRQGELVDEAVQDLVVDCLEHPDAIAAMSARERHARWFRLVERRAYTQWRRDRHVREDVLPLDRLVGRPMEVAEGLLPKEHHELVERLADSGAWLKNGRLNAEATSTRLGLPARVVRAAWNEVAAELGFGDEFLAFWRNRLVEALLGLAADRLRDRGLLRVYDESRWSPPDPRGRLQRIRSIRNHLRRRPLPRDLRGVLAQFGTSKGARLGAREALAAAARLAPGHAGVHLWRFECAIAERELREAVDALRDARACGADPGRVVLARARLLEAAGKEAAAGALLRRGWRRHRGDRRLRIALATFESSARGGGA